MIVCILFGNLVFQIKNTLDYWIISCMNHLVNDSTFKFSHVVIIQYISECLLVNDKGQKIGAAPLKAETGESDAFFTIKFFIGILRRLHFNSLWWCLLQDR